MNTFQVIILIAIIGNTTLAVLVLSANPKRTLNISFLGLASLIFMWLAAMGMGSLPLHESAMLFWTRQASAQGGLLPIGFFLIYQAVTHPNINILKCLYNLRYLIVASVLMLMLCHSPYFIRSVEFSEDLQVVIIGYGLGFVFFIIYFLIVIILITIGYYKVCSKSSGVQREEYLFVQIGGGASLLFGITLLSLGVALDYQGIGIFMPLSVLILDGFIAYGIATRKILSASLVLQRTLSYTLMVIYLSALYVFVYMATAWILALLTKDTTFIAHMLAAIVLSFSVAPAHSWMQGIAHHLLPNSTPVNADDVLKRAKNIFQEVSIDAKLTYIFTQLVKETYGTAELTVLRPGVQHSYQQTYPPIDKSEEILSIEGNNPLLRLLHHELEPLTDDMLQRMRTTPKMINARHTLHTMKAAVIAGCFIRNEIKAIILLSAKKSGRIYDRNDQRTIQILCDQFAVALENSNLYTEVQNAKIYNDILLNAMTSGIIAVSAKRVVTVFNKRAQSLTGLDEADVIDHPVSVLPKALAEGLSTVLDTQTGFLDRDSVIRTGNENIPIRVSGEIFHSHTGQLLGALVIFTDLTEIRQMEAQIRRSDRLSSIGTLSAGMAHEIKNPLVTIKTFTQLLPDQYKDEEFRQTFFNLVGQEVKRIDTIVNRLLNFARPASATLVPLSLHDVVDGSLQLIAQQLTQNGIALERHLDAARHRISADASQLNQVFINFLLNAVHAMKDGGTLTVRTSLHRPPPDAPALNGWRNGYCIRLDIEDTGCGIPPENLDRIFDPFFTTKEHGVGLGLSVSHGIIAEHKGIIHVESRLNLGTHFHIYFPLLETS